MFKNILSVVAGFFSGTIVTYLIEKLGHIIYPIAENINYNDPAAVAQMMANMPVGGFLFVLIAWLLGAFVGAIVTSLINKDKALRNSLALGFILLVFATINMLMINHPAWFWIVSIIGYIPSTVAGSLIICPPPKQINVEREMVINKPIDVVFDYLLHLKEQNKWSVWAKMDPNMNVTFTGEDATVGFVSAWEGNKKVGKGFQEIKSFTKNERIDIRLKFEKPWESESKSYYLTEDVNGKTLIKWGLITQMAFPMNLFSLIMDMDKTLGNDLTGGLTNLKELLEN